MRSLRSILPCLLVLSTCLGSATFAEDVSIESLGPEIRFTSEIPGEIVLTVVELAGGGVVEELRSPGGEILFPLSPPQGGERPDGVYGWEVLVLPQIDPPLAQAIADARAENDTDFVEQLITSGQIRSTRASGAFSIAEGEFVVGTTDPSGEDSDPMARESGLPQVDLHEKDTLTNGDGEIRSSLCVGFACTDPESYGWSTIKMKEHNLRLHFDDSSTGTFPSGDWNVVANDSTNGGASYLAFESITKARRPFKVSQEARANALVVDSGNRVGFGTAVPAFELHVASGNTPTLRLQQDGSTGFLPQTWDLAGNESNFFVRNAEDNKLPLRIFPGASENTLALGEEGVAFGHASPSAAIHVKGTTTAAQVRVENTAASSSARDVFLGETAGPPRFSISNTTTGSKWFVGQNGTGALTLSKSGTPSNEFRLNGLDAGSNPGRAIFQGDVTATQFVNSSDRALKTAFRALDVAQVLARVVALPITEWQYRSQAESVRHIGPMAQDFHAAFGLGGDDDRHIGTVDAAGVALAAIQGLARELEAVRDENRTIREINQALVERLDALEAAISSER